MRARLKFDVSKRKVASVLRDNTALTRRILAMYFKEVAENLDQFGEGRIESMASDCTWPAR